MSRKPSSRNTMLSALMTGQATPSKDAKDGPLPPREEHLHPRVSAGAVGALRNTLAHITKDGRVVELDPAAIDPSPYPDRLGGAEDSAAIEQLAASIARNGQEVPVLVRPHPERANRYQTIYGHRRVRAIAGLGQGQKVRAIVRDLTDEELL
ncbi:ParB/RepB/Spo0J family partition protein, partial [Rhizobium sp. YJ-22]|uniref:ParB/RepB/Spo0J family partition protein n=1 Tax=Rhizobium sp. YJ-22 TaxID=3037556 RepID=UPI0024128110